MTNPSIRRVCVIGERLALLAREAFPTAQLEVVTPDELYLPPTGGRAADLVLIDGEAAAPNVLAAEIEELARRVPQPAVVLAGSQLTAVLVRAVLRLERSDVLDGRASSEDLSRIGFGLTASEVAAERTGSRCWSVLGAVGGAGATTLAIEVAALAASRGQKTCIVDLNLADGAAAAYLGAPSNMLLNEASGAPERIDPALLQAFSAPGGRRHRPARLPARSRRPSRAPAPKPSAACWRWPAPPTTSSWSTCRACASRGRST
jgi:pilus assembly protein CpaE